MRPSKENVTNCDPLPFSLTPTFYTFLPCLYMGLPIGSSSSLLRLKQQHPMHRLGAHQLSIYCNYDARRVLNILFWRAKRFLWGRGGSWYTLYIPNRYSSMELLFTSNFFHIAYITRSTYASYNILANSTITITHKLGIMRNIISNVLVSLVGCYCERIG